LDILNAHNSKPVLRPSGFPTRKASFPFLQRYAVLLPPGASAAVLDPDLSDEAAGQLCRELLQVRARVQGTGILDEPLGTSTQGPIDHSRAAASHSLTYRPLIAQTVQTSSYRA